jgi:5,10-methylenetetrahydromethanopterin reductase
MVEFGHCTIAPPLRGAALALEDEQLGFDIRYFGDNHSLHPDPFVALFDAARATTRIKLATGIVTMVTRYPSVLANLAAPLQLASNGRAILGIGKGDSVVAMVGKRPQKHDEFVSNATLLRAFLHRETVRLGSYDSSLAWLAGQDYAPVPIEIAGAGARTLAAAATLADRIQLTVGAPPERIRWALDIIGAALADSGRDRREVHIGALVPLCVDASRTVAAERLRTGTAVIAHMASLPGMDLSTQPDKLRQVTTRLRHAYDYEHHNMEQANPMRDLVDAEFADWYGIGGPPAYITERLGELVELGIDYFVLGTVPRAEREILAAEVMPRIRKLGGERR